jgi:hypothetical protein
MTRGVQVTFDAADPHRLARWWADLLHYEIVDAHDLVTRLLADGAVSEDEVVRIDNRLFLAGAVAATDPGGVGPRLFFQQVPEPKTAKNRVHLDVPIEGQLDDEVERVVASGASLTEFVSYPGHRAAVMRDIEGNEFCLH